MREAEAQGIAQEEDAGAAWLRHMRAGDFAAAWEVSDRVLQERAGRPCWQLPRHQQWLWDGTPPDGRRVLVRCYHGLGDTLHFARYLPLLRRRAAEVTLWAQPALLPLLGTLDGVDRLLPLHDGAPEVEYDLDVEIMELPHLFRSTLQTLPRAVPYLHAEPAPLTRGAGLAVGLVWRAGEWDERRSIPTALLAPLAAAPGVEWHLLQRGSALAQRPAGFGTLSGSDDVLHTARVMRALDLVLTVDSLPAHLAGALGVPVWTLLCHQADWRWLEGRDDSPWYPSMRLFRQPHPGGWAPLLQRVAAALQQRAQGQDPCAAANGVHFAP